MTGNGRKVINVRTPDKPPEATLEVAVALLKILLKSHE
jgi:hypothetical protein